MSDGSWDAFVRNTPIGFIPVGIVGPVRAYRVACGPMADLFAYFESVATAANWPGWLTECDAAEVRRAAVRARRRERVCEAATKNYPAPNAKRARPAMFITGTIGAALVNCTGEKDGA